MLYQTDFVSFEHFAKKVLMEVLTKRSIGEIEINNISNNEIN